MKSSLRNSLYLFSLSPALVCIYGNLHGEWWSFANLIYSLGILALFEWIGPAFSSNEHSSKNDWIPDFILLLHIPFQIAVITSLVWGYMNGILSPLFIIPAALSTGINSGSSAIVVAHELIHRKSKFMQAMGKILLFSAGNTYFFVEHLRVHHKWVATDRDPATAKKDESLYAFFTRSVAGQFTGAIQLEHERLNKEAKKLNLLNHYVYRQLILHILLLIFFFVIGGEWLVLAWIVQCFTANFLLEYTNYIEHYGMSREENTRVTEIHSWDSDLFVSRFVLVDLSRHADHHFYASKPYHTLQNYPTSHKLPSGYAGLFFLAAIPPIWFKVMNPRIPKTS
jgi:alkane 1-monooxygenase